jgi:hypothetical protein
MILFHTRIYRAFEKVKFAAGGATTSSSLNKVQPRLVYPGGLRLIYGATTSCNVKSCSLT